jgi:hypothetical protein
MPNLGRAAHLDTDDFRRWNEQALATIRNVCRGFQEPKDLAWRAQAVQALKENFVVDAPGVYALLAPSRPENI